jgi:hypothetical protein
MHKTIRMRKRDGLSHTIHMCKFRDMWRDHCRGYSGSAAQLQGLCNCSQTVAQRARYHWWVLRLFLSSLITQTRRYKNTLISSSRSVCCVSPVCDDTVTTLSASTWLTQNFGELRSLCGPKWPFLYFHLSRLWTQDCSFGVTLGGGRGDEVLCRLDWFSVRLPCTIWGERAIFQPFPLI